MLAVVADHGPRLHLLGRSLVAHALESVAGLGGLDVVVVGEAPRRTPTLAADAPWRPRAGTGLLVLDPMCPLLPPSTVRECLTVLTPDSVVVGLRPVTDTIKEVRSGQVVGTVDRDRLAALASPLVVGAGLLDPLAAAFPRAGDLADSGALLEFLAARATVTEVQVPSLARRISDVDDIALLECLHALRRTLRER